MTLPLLHVVGDSISMHYGPYLEPLLRNVMNYSRKQATGADPESANGGDSNAVLGYLRNRLMAAPKVDLLLINCGLHDIKHNPDQPDTQVPVSIYEDNLRAIVVMGRDHGAQVVWVRTTPVVDVIHNSRNQGFKRYAEDVAHFNRVADRVMAEHGVPVIDLCTFTGNLGDDEVYIDHVHFTDTVRMQQAAFIAGRLYAMV